MKGNNSIQRWNHKVGALRRALRGWASHTNGVYKQKKKILQLITHELDIATKVGDLIEHERETHAQARDDLAHLLREIKYFQQAKVKNILLGDNNTRYF